LTEILTTVGAGAVVLGVVIGIIAFRTKRYERRWVRTFKAVPNGIELLTHSGEKTILPWSDLTEIDIVTTDKGPIETDLWWEMISPMHRVFEISGDHPNAPEFLEILQELPGFDNEAAIKASFSTRNARFVVWKAKPTADH
jgi:hypothetical protein